MNVEVVGMEDYVASDERPLDLCLKGVAGADLYVGIFAWRYGFVPSTGNPRSRSITELEYCEARRLGRKCLIFLLPETAPWPIIHCEQEPGGGQLKRLREELRQNHVVDFFSTAAELAAKVGAAVHMALADLTGTNRADQRVRAREVLPHEVQPPTHDFTGRGRELAVLRQAIQEKHWSSVGVFGAAGIGKTELAKETDR
jgi:hypothetical protein